jgi:hypothetical protein
MKSEVLKELVPANGKYTEGNTTNAEKHRWKKLYYIFKRTNILVGLYLKYN